MNDKDIAKVRNQNARKYDHSSRIHRGYVKIQSKNTLLHDMAVWMIGEITARGGDVRIILPIIQPFIEGFCSQLEVSQALEDWCFSGSERDFITEAKGLGKFPIRDIVILDSGEEIEVDVEHGNVEDLKKLGRTIYSLQHRKAYK